MHIRMEHIWKHFGAVAANRDITLEIPSGTILGLVGENGAGKTTLMRVLAGYLTPDRGRILLNGKPVTLTSPRDGLHHGIGMLHQDPMDVPNMTVLDNFILGAPGLQAWRRRQARRLLLQLARDFGFTLHPETSVQSLTIGERQQLEILRMIGWGMRVLIFDEPTTGLSSLQKEHLFALMRRLATEGKTIVFVTHKLEEARELCHRIAVLRKGALVGEFTPPYHLEIIITHMFGKPLEPLRPDPIPWGPPLLQLDNVTVESERLQLRRVHLTVHQGEILGLAGLEGSGQRSFLHLCAGLLPPAHGRLLLDGDDLTGYPYETFRQHGVVYLPAARFEEALFPDLNIEEHVWLSQTAEHSRGLWLSHRELHRTAERLIQRYHIDGTPHTLARVLSGGNQQRLLLSLVPAKSRLLLLEHPTRGLDMESSLWVWERILHRCRQGNAVLFTSQDLDELLTYSHRLLVFFAGRVSRPLDASQLTAADLGYLIGGVGFEQVAMTQEAMEGDSTP